MTKREKENLTRLNDNLRRLGFTYGEAVSLRRIELTLQRWGEREAGDGSDWAVERDETTGKPFNVYHGRTDGNAVRRYAVPDKEAGALRRLAAIVAARNGRMGEGLFPDKVLAYHQGDCRGCNLYLVTLAQLADRVCGGCLPLEQYYTRGLAVCI